MQSARDIRGRKMMINFKKILSVVLAIAMLVSIGFIGAFSFAPIQALGEWTDLDLLAHDGFNDLPLGTITSEQLSGSGFGFGAAEFATGWGITVTANDENPLTHPLLQTSPNYLTITHGNVRWNSSRIWRAFDLRRNGPFADFLTADGSIGRPGTVLYLSMLMDTHPGVSNLVALTNRPLVGNPMNDDGYSIAWGNFEGFGINNWNIKPSTHSGNNWALHASRLFGGASAMENEAPPNRYSASPGQFGVWNGWNPAWNHAVVSDVPANNPGFVVIRIEFGTPVGSTKGALNDWLEDLIQLQLDAPGEELSEQDILQMVETRINEAVSNRLSVEWSRLQGIIHNDWLLGDPWANNHDPADVLARAAEDIASYFPGWNPPAHWLSPDRSIRGNIGSWYIINQQGHGLQNFFFNVLDHTDVRNSVIADYEAIFRAEIEEMFSGGGDGELIASGLADPSIIQMFVNPDLSAGKPASPDVEIRTILDVTFRGMMVDLIHGNSFGDIRVGRTFDAVTPFYDDGTIRTFAPVSNIAPGTFDAPVEVTLISETPNARIYYTLDGTRPIPGTSYLFNPNSPITIGFGQNITITAIAVDPTGILQDSVVVAGEYRVRFRVLPPRFDPNLLALSDWSDLPTGTHIYQTNSPPVVTGMENAYLLNHYGGSINLVRGAPFNNSLLVSNDNPMYIPGLISTHNYLRISRTELNFGKRFNLHNFGGVPADSTFNRTVTGRDGLETHITYDGMQGYRRRIGAPGTTMWVSVVMDPIAGEHFVFALPHRTADWGMHTPIAFGSFQREGFQTGVDWRDSYVGQGYSGNYWGLHAARLYGDASFMNGEMPPLGSEAAPNARWDASGFINEWHPNWFNPVVTDVPITGEPTLVVLKIEFNEAWGSVNDGTGSCDPVHCICPGNPPHPHPHPHYGNPVRNSYDRRGATLIPGLHEHGDLPWFRPDLQFLQDYFSADGVYVPTPSMPHAHHLSTRRFGETIQFNDNPAHSREPIPSTVWMFINPDLSQGEPNVEDADAYVSTILDLAFGAWAVHGGYGRRLSDVRVGLTFEAVAPFIDGSGIQTSVVVGENGQGTAIVDVFDEDFNSTAVLILAAFEEKDGNEILLYANHKTILNLSSETPLIERTLTSNIPQDILGEVSRFRAFLWNSLTYMTPF